jgi:hypothetical protein
MSNVNNGQLSQCCSTSVLKGDIVGRDSAHYIALTRPAKITTNFRPNFNHENGNFFYHYGSEGRRIFTIGKSGANFKILKCSKQTLSPFPQQSTLSERLNCCSRYRHNVTSSPDFSSSVYLLISIILDVYNMCFFQFGIIPFCIIFISIFLSKIFLHTHKNVKQQVFFIFC